MNDGRPILQIAHHPGLQTRVAEVTHPSLCTGNPYSQDMQRLVIFIEGYMNNANDANVRNMVAILGGNHMYPLSRTTHRWERLQEEVGYLRPCRRIGNSFCERMSEIDLIYLALFCAFYPKCTIAEVNAFLYTANLGNPNFSFYTQSHIYFGEKLIGLTCKRASTIAYQALYPQNLQKRYKYWNYPFPLGIADIPRSQIIDLDKCGIFMETTTNRTYGKIYVGCQVNEVGPYSKDDKWNILLAVCGEDAVGHLDAHRCADVWLDGGTTINRFMGFIELILESIRYATEDDFYVFTMDNLNAHGNISALALIHMYGHGMVFRAPYWPVDETIEFIFNAIQTLIRARLYEIRTSQDLIGTIYESIQGIRSFENYFINCRFVLN